MIGNLGADDLVAVPGATTVLFNTYNIAGFRLPRRYRKVSTTVRDAIQVTKMNTQLQDHGRFLRVDLERWVYGTVEKHQQGEDWNAAWFKTYREIVGEPKTTGAKSCPRIGARTLYELGRIKDAGVSLRTCELSELWNRRRTAPTPS